MGDFDELQFNINSKSKSSEQQSKFKYLYDRMTKDMHFVSTFLIIYGAINCLTIVGAVIGVPLIFAGLSIKTAAGHFSIFKLTDNSASLKNGFEEQSKFFNIIKILIIAGLVLTAISIIGVIFFLTYFVNSFNNAL